MTKKRDCSWLYRPCPATPVEHYWLVVDQDFRRPARLQDIGYYFVSNEQKATVFVTEQEALDFIARVKPPSERNPLVAVRRTR